MDKMKNYYSKNAPLICMTKKSEQKYKDDKNMVKMCLLRCNKSCLYAQDQKYLSCLFMKKKKNRRK